MAFSILVCAMFLLTILYFAALVTGEIALWLVGRFENRDPKPVSVLTAQS
jgi:hypothetical protein